LEYHPRSHGCHSIETHGKIYKWLFRVPYQNERWKDGGMKLIYDVIWEMKQCSTRDIDA
jgi:hypothetical protein